MRMISYLSFELLRESRRDIIFRYDIQSIRIDGRRGRGPLKLQESYDTVDLALVGRIGESTALGC